MQRDRRQKHCHSDIAAAPTVCYYVWVCCRVVIETCVRYDKMTSLYISISLPLKQLIHVLITGRLVCPVQLLPHLVYVMHQVIVSTQQKDIHTLHNITSNYTLSCLHTNCMFEFIKDVSRHIAFHCSPRKVSIRCKHLQEAKGTDSVRCQVWILILSICLSFHSGPNVLSQTLQRLMGVV